MNRMTKAIASAALAGTLARGAPAEAHQNAIGRAGAAGAKDAGEVVLVSLGAAIGVAALIGGSLWYYFHHRRAERPVETSPPPDGR